MANADDVQREHEGTGKDQQIAAVQRRQTRRRYGEKIKPNKSRESAEPNPQGRAARSEKREQERNKHNKESGDKRGLGGSGKREPGRLKGVSAKHATAHERACTEAACICCSKLASIHEYQHHRSEEKAQSQKDKDGRIGQS